MQESAIQLFTKISEIIFGFNQVMRTRNTLKNKRQIFAF